MSQVTVETPTCVWCGSGGQVEVSADQLAKWRAGAFIQDAFPTLSASLREQLLTGTHGPCWDEMWGGCED